MCLRQRRFRPLQKPLLPLGLDGAGKSDRALHNPGRWSRGQARSGAVQPSHNVAPDGCRSHDAADVAHRFTGEVPHPDANGIVASVAEAPVVAHLFTGTSLYRTPKARCEGAFEPERDAAAVSVGEDMRHQKGGRLGVYTSAGLGGWLV